MKARLEALADENKKNTEIYTPVFFRLKNKSDRERFEQLLNTPGIMVMDEILGQAEEYVKSKNPRKVFKKDELTRAAIDHMGSGPREEYGVWVYYPWSKRLVHILDEEEFVEVRTNRNQYKITPEEKELLSHKKIGVLGLSVGQSIALTIAMERICGELRIADFDILELSNLNRIRTGLYNLGVPKTIAVAREIAEIDPYFRVTCFHAGATEDNIDEFITKNGKLDILVDECDGLLIKIVCRQKARHYQIPVVMDTADRGMIDVERFDLEPDRSILHGYIDHLDIEKVREAKTNEEKVPYLLPMLGIDTVSERMKASMLEIEQTITTWPQLASSVIMGGGLGADVCRRILLDSFHESGRYFVDVEQIVADKNKPVIENTPLKLNPTISEDEMLELSKKYQTVQKDQIDLPEDTVRELVSAATMSTSGANGQAWKWMYHGSNLYLFLDSIYEPALLDTDNTTTLIGLGSASENLVLKAHEMNLEVLTEAPSLNSSSKLIAVFRFFKKGARTGIEPHAYDELASVIPLRHTNRIIGKRHKIDAGKYEYLQKVARSVPGADLKIVHDDAGLAELGEIVAKMDKMRIMHRGGHQDFRAEMRWNQQEVEMSRNGIDLEGTVDLTPSEFAGLRICKDWSVVKLLNDWKGGTGLEKVGRKTVAASSALGLFTMPRFSCSDFYIGGRALERVWLAANKDGISVHPISLSTLIFNTDMYGKKGMLPPHMHQEAQKLRIRFEELFSIDSQTAKILLVRFFISGPPKKRSLRYPLDQVLKFV
jgi:tRNA A37 threonylcarbamoyladenosine dehydratase